MKSFTDPARRIIKSGIVPALLLAIPLLFHAGGCLATAEHIPVSEAQYKRAGIATTAVVSRLDSVNRDGAANDAVLSGTVVAPPASIAVLASPYGGMVQQVHATSLQQVRQGMAVVTLFSQPWMEAQRDYLQAATQARLAEAKLARDESLFADGIIAAVRLDESRSASVLAGLTLDERAQGLRTAGWDAAAIAALVQEHKLSPLLVIRAPASGTVLELEAVTGQRVEAGAPLAKINRGGALWVDLQASRQQAAQLRIGDILYVKGCGKLRVVAVSPLLNSSNQSVQVRAVHLVNEGCLKVNAFVEARMGPAAAKASTDLLVPAAALVMRGAETFVFVKNSRGFSALPVRSTIAGADMVWVTGALTAGDQVAVQGIAAIKGIWAGFGADNAASATATPATATPATGSK